MKKRNKKGSVFTLLLGNYIFFTLLLAFALFLIFALFLVRTFLNLPFITPEQLRAYDEMLKNEEYEYFPTERLLGRESYIMVLDDKGKIVYGVNDKVVSLSPEEIALIPSYLSDPAVTEIKGPDGGSHYLVFVERPSEKGLEQETYIFDGNHHLIYRSGDWVQSNLTLKEYQLFTNTYLEDFYLNKYQFNNHTGAQYTLLLFRSRQAEELALGKMDNLLTDSFVLFIFVYCILIFCFILWLKQKINKPVRILNNAFNEFEIGREISSSYRGPKEFAEIFDSFSAMTKRLEESEDKRRKLENDKQKMLADIAHDLKTPITVVQGYAKALNDHMVPPAEQAKYLTTIEQKTSDINTLINTFYEYSKMEHPDYKLTLEHIDICNYFRDYVAEKYAELEMEGFLPEVKIPEDHIYCNIDKVELKRAFENIINNAVKHNESGITIYFVLEVFGGNVKITLADNGVGIPKMARQRIFDAFVVGEESRSNHGSGLGLSIAKRVIEEHQGTIKLVEAPVSPMKTVFEIILPIHYN